MLFFPKKNIRISVRDKKLVIETKSGVNLYRFLINEKIIQPTLCDGSGQCGKCKIRFTGANIPRPTYKESLILAKVNIEAGYRLACQHTVKKDIEIDTSEIPASSSFFMPKADYPKALKDPAEKKRGGEREPEGETEEPVFTAEEPAPEERGERPEADEPISINEFKPMASRERPPESRDDEGPSDGIFMIQQRGGVRYFCYSAALDNIVSEGTAETDEPLRDVIDSNLVPDFIHNVLKIRDIDRVLMLTEKGGDYETKNILDMISYFKFDVGTLLCEVIMPYGENHDVVRFFRLLGADRGHKLVFSLDMLDRVHYLTDKLITDMRFGGLTASNILSIHPRGKNPVTDFDDELNVRSVEKKGSPPDGVTLSALLKLVKLMHKKGVIDNSFTIKPGTELARLGVPLELTVRVTAKDGRAGFYMFRDRFAELSLSQNDLYALAEIRDYIITVIRFTIERIGRVAGLIFYTASNHENLINLMFDLGFIPKEFAEKTAYFPGDATVQAIKLFKEKDIDSFVSGRFGNVAALNLASEEKFIKIGKDRGLLD